MKAFALIFCIYMVSLVCGLPIISKPLENNPDHLVWEALLTSDTHRPDDKSRKIPKSIFITPNLNESKGNCPPDHKLGPDGRCYKTLQIDPLLMLKKQIESLLKNNSTATTEYDDDYDYSEYGESTESMHSNGQYTVPLSLGFSSENRIPSQQHRTQHTTFPNLNRIVKDDAHVPSSTTINTDSRENQPFRATTTGIDLGSEEVNVESKHKPNVSVATTSSASSSATVAYTTESSSQSNNLQNSNTSESTIATIIPTINLESVTDEIVSMTNSFSEQNLSSTFNTTVETVDALSTVSTPARNNDENITSMGNVENTTSNGSSEKNTDTTVGSPLKSNVANVEAPEDKPMLSSTERIEPSTIAQNKGIGQSLIVDAIASESSTKTIIEHVETQNESSVLKLSVLPQVDDKKEKLALEIDELTKKQANLLQSTEKQPTTDDMKIQTEANVERSDVIEPSVESMNLKLTSEPSTERSVISTESKMVVTQTPNTTKSSSSTSSTTAKDGLVEEKSDSYEVIEAYFIPSEMPEEIDPAVGKNINISTAESRYRMENTSIINDDELVEAELAPVIDTGIDGRSNIELVKSTATDESSPAKFDDDKKNFTARLAEESLFQEHSTTLEVPHNDHVPKQPAQHFNEPFKAFELNETVHKHNDSVLKTESIENDEDNNNKKVINIEEALSGASHEGGFNLGSDSTTEPIDYDSKEVKIQASNPNNYEGELPSKEATPFNKLSNFFRLSPPPSVRPSIYSTFISRLKVAPPFVELHEHPETVQYSHTPFDITSTFQNTHRPNGRFSVSDTTHPTYTLPGETEHNYEDVEQPTPVRAKSLQLGINCYVKNLEKQQYIICDDA